MDISRSEQRVLHLLAQGGRIEIEKDSKRIADVVCLTRDGWRYPDAINADYVWIPAHLPVVRDLEVHGWRTLCKGTQSTLLGREQNRAPCAQQTRTSEREFPQL